MKSFDERTAEIAKSQYFSDIRIPMDIAARLRKSRAEKKETVDGVDLDKIRAQKEREDDQKDDDEEQEKPEPEEQIDGEVPGETAECMGENKKYEKSLRAAETETLLKSRLKRVGRQPDPFFVKVGKWFSDSLAKSDVATLRKAVAAALPDYQKEAKGETLVAGLPEPKAVAQGDNDPKIVRINTEIMKLQERMRDEGSDPFDNSVIFNQLREAYERLAEAVMNSMGLGQQTEDLIPECAEDKEPPAAMASVHKSQAVTILENTGARIVVSE